MGLGDKSLSNSLMRRESVYGGMSYSDEMSKQYDGIVNRALSRNQRGGARYQKGGWAPLPKADGHGGDPYDYYYNSETNQFSAGENSKPFSEGSEAYTELSKRYGNFIKNGGGQDIAGVNPNLNSGTTPGTLYQKSKDILGPTLDLPKIPGTSSAEEVSSSATPNAGVAGNAQDPTLIQPRPEEDIEQLYTDDEINNYLSDGIDMSGDPATNGGESTDPSWWDENKRGMGNGLLNAATGLIGIAPNLANIKDYKNLPGVLPPQLQRTVQTQAPSFEASRQAIIGQGRNASQRAEGMSTSDQLAANAMAMSGTNSALSQLSGQEAQAEASTDARNAQSVNRANAANTQILNKYSNQTQSRDLAQLKGIARERGAIGNKTLGFMGDLRNQDLQRQQMDLTRQRYNTTGVMDRNIADYIEINGEPPPWAGDYYKSLR